MAFVDPRNLPPSVAAALGQGGAPQPPAGPAALSGATVDQAVAPVSGGASLGDQLRAKGVSIPTPSVPGASGSDFLSDLHEGANSAAAQNPDNSAPGSWARNLLAGTMHAIGGGVQQYNSKVAGPLSDVATAAAAGRNTPVGAGKAGAALIGLGNAFKAHYDRMNAEQKDQLLTAEANARMMHEQALTHKLGQDAINESVANGQKMISTLTDPSLPVQAEVGGEHLNGAQLTALMQSGKVNPREWTVYPDGQAEVQDKDGNMVPQTTYTALKLPKEVTFSSDNPQGKAMLDLFNKYYKPAGGGDWGDKLTLTGAQANSMYTVATQKKALDDAARIHNEQAEIDEGKRQVDIESLHSHDDVVKALNQSDNNVTKATSILAGMKNPDGSMKYPNAANDLSGYMGKQAYDARIQQEAKADEKLGPIEQIQQKASTATLGELPSMLETVKSKLATSTDPAEKQQLGALQTQLEHEIDAQVNTEASAAAKKKSGAESFVIDDNNKNLTGQQFLNTLKPGEAALVKDIGTGHIVIERMGYLATRNPNLLAAVAQAYPDFDSSKAEAYPALYKNFVQGDISKKLKAGSVVIQHLNRVLGNTNFWSMVPGSTANTQRNVDIHQLAEEVAFFQKGGSAAPSKDEVEKVENALNPLNPLKRKDAAEEQLRLVADNLGQFKQQWDNGAPSKVYQAPMPYISQDSIDKANSILSGQGPTPEKNEVVNPNAPVTATPKVNLPPQALKQLSEGHNTTFNNGQVWTLKNGQPFQVK